MPMRFQEECAVITGGETASASLMPGLGGRKDPPKGYADLLEPGVQGIGTTDLASDTVIGWYD